MSDWAKGSFDIHVHGAPDIFPRWGTAWDVAESCKQAGMAGFMFKYHHGSTVELASVLQEQFPELKIYGGTTLNYFVGGLNPYAVQTALKLGGKMIWLPTVHAANHAAHVGELGGFGFQNTGLEKIPEKGLSIIDDQKELVDPMKEILNMLHTKAVVLSTGHISYEEINSLVKYIENNNLQIRLLIGHVSFKAPALTLEQLKDLIRDWIWFEECYISISKLVHCISVEEMASRIKALPDANWVFSSDSGQKENLKCPEAIADFAAQLEKQGVPTNIIERALREEPVRLFS